MDQRQERFRQLYEDHYDLLTGYAVRRTDGREDAQDVVAETFVVAWRRLDDIPDGDRARLWLYGTARKVVGNHHRSLDRRRRLHHRMSTLAGASGDTVDPDGTGLSEQIVAAFRRLSGADRELLLLSGWEELGADDIAVTLGTTAGNVRVKLHRARRRFAAHCEAVGLQHRRRTGHVVGGRAIARPGLEESA